MPTWLTQPIEEWTYEKNSLCMMLFAHVDAQLAYHFSLQSAYEKIKALGYHFEPELTMYDLCRQCVEDEFLGM